MNDAASTKADGSAPTARDLVVFLSGFGKELVAQDAGDIAARLAHALNKRAGSGAARFKVGPVQRVGADGAAPIGAATIKRLEGERETASLDVYEIPAAEILTAPVTARSAWSKAALVGVATFTAVFLVLRVLWPLRLAPPSETGGRKVVRYKAPWGAKPLTARQFLQVAWVSIILFSLSSYLILVVVSLLQVALMDSLPAFLEPYRGGIEPFRNVVLLTAAAIAFLPGRVKNAMGSVAVEYTTFIEYFEAGRGRPSAAGRLESLLNRLADDNVAYRRVHVIGYSFGSLVAIDSIYRAEEVPGPRLAQIHTLFTIACPFDLTRLFWARHFTSRHVAGGPRQWLNVVSKGDPFASTFRDDEDLTLPATHGVELATPDPAVVVKPTNLPFPAGPVQPGGWLLSVLLLRGLRDHLKYWDSTGAEADSCFDLFVNHVYTGDDLLQ